jgi:aminoglycoside phosphotransferase (APT) family kinase protein
MSACKLSARTGTGRIPAMDRVADWLKRHLPADRGEARVFHGDYRCDNMIFAPGAEPRVLAVLDWELSTLGDPVADFVYHLMMYRMPAGMFTGLKGLDLSALGIPSEDDYVAAYCRRTGRDRLPHRDYLMVFVMFRLAGIVHGIRGRVVRGSASSAHASDPCSAIRLTVASSTLCIVNPPNCERRVPSKRTAFQFSSLISLAGSETGNLPKRETLLRASETQRSF